MTEGCFSRRCPRQLASCSPTLGHLSSPDNAAYIRVRITSRIKVAVRLHIPHGCLPRPSRMDAVCSDLVQGTRTQFIMPQGRPPPRLLYLPFLLIFCPLVVKKKIKVYPADSQPEVSRERSTIESLELLPMRASRPSLESGREKKHSGKCHRLRFHPPRPHPQFTINLISSSPPKLHFTGLF